MGSPKSWLLDTGTAKASNMPAILSNGWLCRVRIQGLETQCAMIAVGHGILSNSHQKAKKDGNKTPINMSRCLLNQRFDQTGLGHRAGPCSVLGDSIR